MNEIGKLAQKRHESVLDSSLQVIYIYGNFFLDVAFLGKIEKPPERLCIGSITQNSPYFYIVEDLRSQTYNFHIYWLLK